MDDPQHAQHARERAYLELCRRMAGLRDQDPAKLRFYWGSLFVAVLVEMGGLGWDDVEPLWQRWRQDTDGVVERHPRPIGERRRARHGRSHRSRGGRSRRRRGWWREPPFPLPEHAPDAAP